MSRPIDLAMMEAFLKHGPLSKLDSSALLAECRRLRESEARLREALQDAAAFIALAADRGVLNGEEVAPMLDDYSAALAQVEP